MAEEKEKSQEEMVKEAVKEAQKAAKDIPSKDQQKEQEEQEEQPEEKAESEEEDQAKEKASEQEPSDKKKKKPKKDKKDEKIEELNDKLMRQVAEFDNFRKRTEKEKSQMYEIGVRDIVEKLLPIVDNFERGLGAVQEEEKENSFVQGMEMTYKQLLSMLEEIGVTPIEAVGQKFDPDFHNAVMHVEDDQYGENEVVEELQKGYLYRDSVVRHSLVKVAN